MAIQKVEPLREAQVGTDLDLNLMSLRARKQNPLLSPGCCRPRERVTSSTLVPEQRLTICSPRSGWSETRQDPGHQAFG
jgi:hypothetical protein